MSYDSIDLSLLGWHRDDAAVDDFCQALDAAGTPAVFSAAQPDLAGHWERLKAAGETGIFLQDAESELFGHTLPAESQRRGTCVSRGTMRAIRDAYYWGIVHHEDLATPRDICFEPIYGGSRVQVGGGRLGTGDGSVGAWAAQFVHDFGLLARGVYGGVDLTQPREDLAVDWGNPGVGVPAGLLAEARAHPVGACHFCPTTAAIADAVSAGYGVAYCSNLIWGDRDRNGIARPVTSGGHCESICGVARSPQGDTLFIRQQSWGARPNGPDLLNFAGGTKRLRQGAYGAFEEDIAKGLRGGGEAWAFGNITGWRPQTLEEALA
jgi:hypothetical protein